MPELGLSSWSELARLHYMTLMGRAAQDSFRQGRSWPWGDWLFPLLPGKSYQIENL